MISKPLLEIFRNAGSVDSFMRLFSYIVTHDTGFAPNPFWGYCTLANCKPVIRRTASTGDWIVGLSPKARGNKIIYAMEVQEIVQFADYFRDKRFQGKKPDYSKDKIVFKCGDNIYEQLSNRSFRQLPSRHYNHKGNIEDLNKKKHDLDGINVLISINFYYFGSNAINLPNGFNDLKVQRAHKNKFPQELVVKFISFISGYKKGIHAPPTKWEAEDNSWKFKCR
jgi:hypothetical protein